MVGVQEQYEVFPYPERDPEDEAKRLITGSPSHPVEMDHFLWSGQRDWSVPLRVLVAGGGTGDGLVQLAQSLASAGRPHEITYVDLSTASREIAEARIAKRGLTGVRFVTGSLLEAPDLGEFDYIDCCGVLHHLPEPDEGFAALRAAVAPGGGMGMMVYAPYGRSGVYPLQEAFGAVLEGLGPKERLAAAKKIVAGLPKGHPFAANVNLGDHHQSDAGFYDLLLHSQDRAYGVNDLCGALDRTGWALASFTTPALYDLARIAPVPEGMSARDQMANAEKLRGTMKMHTAYVVPEGQVVKPARGTNRQLVPHLRGAQARSLARAVAQRKEIPVSHGSVQASVRLPKEAAGVIAGIDGRRSIAEILAGTRLDPLSGGALWMKVEAALEPWGLMLYSGLLRR